MRRRALRHLSIRYAIALSLFAALGITALLSLLPINDQLHSTEVAINTSGRQRGLSQRIARLELELAVDTDAHDARATQELDAAVRQFAAGAEGLAKANLPRPGTAPTALQAIYYQPPGRLAARSKAFLAAVAGVNTASRKSIPDALRVSAIVKDDLAPVLDQATAVYERKAHNLTRRVQSIEISAAFAASILIVLEAALIFWPAQRDTRAVLDELETAIDVLRERERSQDEAARLARLADEMSGVGHWRLDVRTSVVAWSPQLFVIHGLDACPDGPSLEAAIEAYHPDDRDLVRRHVADAITHGRGFDYEVRLVRADGEIRNVMARGAVEFDASGAVAAVVGIFKDVTDARRAEAALRDSEARYRLLAENATDMIITSSLTGRTLYVSPSAVRLTGYEIAEITGVRTLDFIHPEDAATMTWAYRALIAGGPPERVRWRGRHKSGHWVWFESMPALASDPLTGVPNGFTDVVTDVTHRHYIEQAVAQSEARSKLLAENGLDIICQIGLDGRIIYISPSVFDISGYMPSELVGEIPIRPLHPEDRKRVVANFFEIIEGNREELLIEYRLIRKDGSVIWVEARPRAARDPATGRIVEMAPFGWTGIDRTYERVAG